MQRKQAITKKSREANPVLLRKAILRVIDRRFIAQGDIDVPCIPALLETYVARLLAVWEALGKRFSDDERKKLRDSVELALKTGYDASPFARMVVHYEALAPPELALNYTIRLKEHTLEEHYTHWVTGRKPPLFGKVPDAKVLAVAAELGDPRSAPVLDVGAGTGRNAVPLARRGHPVDAIELVPALAGETRAAAAAEKVALEVIEGDVLAPETTLKDGHYKLAVVAEVVTNFRAAADLRTLFTKLAGALAPGGRVLVNAFVSLEGYRPDDLARQVSETAWSRIFTRAELAIITEQLPFVLVSDENAHDYEKANVPADVWPPTGWYVDWAEGRNVFDLPAGKVPVELRWLVYRKK